MSENILNFFLKNNYYKIRFRKMKDSQKNRRKK